MPFGRITVQAFEEGFRISHPGPRMRRMLETMGIIPSPCRSKGRGVRQGIGMHIRMAEPTALI